MTELAGVGVTVREAADAVEADSGASPVLVAVVREFLSKADKVTRLVGEGGISREGVVELEQAGDSAKVAVEADTGASEATTRAVQAAHLAICMLKAKTQVQTR
jgi:hypothetical protein